MTEPLVLADGIAYGTLQAMQSSSEGLLKYAADRRTVGFLAFYYMLFATAWLATPTHPLAIAALTVSLCLMAFFIAVMTHNTIHSPIFHSPMLNRLFSVGLSWGFGAPASGFLPGHNLSHHRYLGLRKDNVRTYKVRYRWNFLNQALFFFHMVPGILRTEGLFVKNVKGDPDARGWYLQHRFETSLLFVAKAALLIVDWKKAVLFVAIPNVYGVWAIFGTNFWQHDGCDEHHPYNHSRSFTSKLLNYVTFNNGFHAVHHEKPGLHWSLLPAYHAENYHAHCHPALEQKSLLIYLWRTCVYPAARLRYDGTPYVLPPKDSDEDWVADAFSTGAARMVYDGVTGKTSSFPLEDDAKAA
jgi:fatty acid desaturase